MYTLHFDGFKLSGTMVSVDIYPSESTKDQWKMINVPRVYVEASTADLVARFLSLTNEKVVVNAGSMVKAVYVNGELHKLHDLKDVLCEENYKSSKILINGEWR